MDHKTIAQIGPWRVVSRENRSGNLTIEVELNGEAHADVVFQEGGTIDLGTKARPWPLGEQGWHMPGAPSDEMRKYRFGPEADVEADPKYQEQREALVRAGILEDAPPS